MQHDIARFKRILASFLGTKMCTRAIAITALAFQRNWCCDVMACFIADSWIMLFDMNSKAKWGKDKNVIMYSHLSRVTLKLTGGDFPWILWQRAGGATETMRYFFSM